MNIDIRKHIVNNFNGDDKEAIKRAIDSSIIENDEISLPGMGVFFELVWKNSNEDLKNKLLIILENSMKQ